MAFINGLETFEESLIYDPESTKPVARIFVDCPGGELTAAVHLYHFLNRTQFTYEFVLDGYVDSAAILLILALCPKNLVVYRNATALLHYAYYQVNTNIMVMRDTSYDKEKHNQHIKYVNLLSELYKEIVSAEKFELVRIGEDVFLNAEELSDIFGKLKATPDLRERMKQFFELT